MYLVVVAVLAILVAVSASAYGFIWSAGQARSDAASSVQFSAERAAARVSSAVLTAQSTVQSLAAQPGVEAVFVRSQGCQLTATGSEAFTSVRLDLVAPDGSVPCSSDSGSLDRPNVHASAPWLTARPGQSQAPVAWRERDGATNTPSIVISAPIVRSGARLGAVAAFLHVPPVAAAVARDLEGADKSSFTLVDSADGRVLSTTELGTAPNRPFATRTTGVWGGLDGVRRVYSSAPVNNSSWRIYVGLPDRVVVQQARGALLREGLVLILAVLVLIGGVAVIERRIGRPLRHLTRSVSAAVHGGLRETLPASGTAEIDALSQAFTTLVDVREGHEAQLAYQATHDPVTGLVNRTLLMREIDAALHRRDHSSTSLLFLGLDRFKLINDGLGHEVGDRILAEVGARLSLVVRSRDVVARFGGDEFVIVLPDTDQMDAASLAEGVHTCLQAPAGGRTANILVHGSIGITTVTGAGSTAEQMLGEATAAMRAAKSTGVRTCHFDQTMTVHAAFALDLERDLRLALERDELVVHFQPFVEIATGRVAGAEALVRWHHPERGMVPPLEFISVAESTGQITDIGLVVLSRACEQAAKWAAAGEAIRVSVNVAVEQLRTGDFPVAVSEVLRRTGLPPDLLCLEITESSMMRSRDDRATDLTRLRDLGVHLAIDDFGTGYSSLSYLHELPVDEIKIDRSFVNRLGIDPRDKHLVEAIIGLANAMDLTIVAEGVETKEQLEFLAERGCQLAQGYLFSPPLRGDAFSAYLEGQSSLTTGSPRQG